ncbi:MAG: hypothetical protein VB142_11340, partial [Burkholderia sp.]
AFAVSFSFALLGSYPPIYNGWTTGTVNLISIALTHCYVLYTPPGERFFCFEPVDHPIRARVCPSRWKKRPKKPLRRRDTAGQAGAAGKIRAIPQTTRRETCPLR